MESAEAKAYSHQPVFEYSFVKTATRKLCWLEKASDAPSDFKLGRCFV